MVFLKKNCHTAQQKKKKKLSQPTWEKKEIVTAHTLKKKNCHHTCEKVKKKKKKMSQPI